MGRETEGTWWRPDAFAGEFLRTIAEQVVSQEIAWADQDMQAGFRGYYRAYWWRERVPQPWLTELGKKRLVRDWLSSYAWLGGPIQYLDWWFPSWEEAWPFREQYRNIFYPIPSAFSPPNPALPPWLYFDPVIDEYARNFRKMTGENEVRQMGMWQDAEFIEFEKPWRNNPLEGFPPSDFEPDDQLPQFARDELVFTRHAFYHALLAKLAPEWKFSEALSGKRVLVYVRPIDDRWQWAIVLEFGLGRMSSAYRYDLLILPTSLQKTIRPQHVVFQYRFPFRQDMTITSQMLALWQADTAYRYLTYERRMTWLEPVLRPYLDSLK